VDEKRLRLVFSGGPWTPKNLSSYFMYQKGIINHKIICYVVFTILHFIYVNFQYCLDTSFPKFCNLQPSPRAAKHILNVTNVTQKKHSVFLTTVLLGSFIYMFRYWRVNEPILQVLVWNISVTDQERLEIF